MNDRRVVLAVVLSLAAVAIVIIAGQVYLSSQNKSLPETLITIAAGSVGAIAGLLVNSSTRPPSTGG